MKRKRILNKRLHLFRQHNKDKWGIPIFPQIFFICYTAFKSFMLRKNYEYAPADTAFVCIGEREYHGEFNTSPFYARFLSIYNKSNCTENSYKPYHAHWIISDNKLLLTFVNGIVDKLELFTSDFIEEYPENDLMHYKEYSGEIIFSAEIEAFEFFIEKGLVIDYKTFILK